MDMQDVSNLAIPEGTVRTIHDKLNTQLWGKIAYSVKYKGDANQQTTTGKNLLPNEITSQTFHGVVITKNSDGSLTLNGVVESGETSYYLALGSFSAVSGVKYTISGVTGWNYNTLQLFGVSSVAFPAGNRIQCYNGPQTVTAQGDESVTVRLYIYAGQNYDNVVIYPMVEQSASASAYEPYTNGISPNPDYPQPVETVTGPQSVTVFGKNLFKMKSTADTVSQVEFTPHSDGTFDVSGTASGNAEFKSEVMPLSESGIVGGQTYKISSTAPNDTNNITYYVHNCTANGAWVKTLLNFSGLSSRTADEPTTDYVYFTIRVNNGKSVNFSNVKTQVEVGTTASTFTAYRAPGTFAVNLGSVELCRIGTYQDYIYKSGGDWYVHKETLKYVYSDSSQTAYFDSSIPRVSFNEPTGIVSSNLSYCNQFTFGDSETTNNKFNFGSTRVFMHSNEKMTSSSNWNSWMSQNPVVFYFPLTTPVNTQITDQTLISQLDSVHQFITRYGYNATVSGNLPLIIDKTNL